MIHGQDIISTKKKKPYLLILKNDEWAINKKFADKKTFLEKVPKILKSPSS